MERWGAERETRVSAAEVEHARDYLRRRGIPVAPADNDCFRLERTGRVVDRVQLVALGLRHFAARGLRSDLRRTD
jgi:hypothetical protein